MKPDSIYYFVRIPEYRTRYKLIGHKGKTISGFPSVYKSGKNKGEGYLIFRKAAGFYRQSRLRFSHTLELVNSQIITGLIFLPEYPCQSYGAYKKYAVLVDFSEDFNQLAIWFFKGLQEAAPILFQRKQAGQIPELTNYDKLNLRHRPWLSGFVTSCLTINC
jgi:hypothetical protein